MSILVRDLLCNAHAIRIEPGDWAAIVRMLSGTTFVEAGMLCRLDDAVRVYVPRDVARMIGRHLERKFLDDYREAGEPPAIPDYIRPIATSNGLWIDPALPLLNRPRAGDFYLRFAHFCHLSEGFLIG